MQYAVNSCSGEYQRAFRFLHKATQRMLATADRSKCGSNRHSPQLTLEVNWFSTSRCPSAPFANARRVVSWMQDLTAANMMCRPALGVHDGKALWPNQHRVQTLECIRGNKTARPWFASYQQNHKGGLHDSFKVTHSVSSRRLRH
jgi:hypothetical protein